MEGLQGDIDKRAQLHCRAEPALTGWKPRKGKKLPSGPWQLLAEYLLARVLSRRFQKALSRRHAAYCSLP